MSALKQIYDDLKQVQDTIDSIEIPARGRCRVYMAKYDYNPYEQSRNENPDAELKFSAGDYILVFDSLDEDGFFIGELIDGRRGFVPSNWVEQLTGEDLFEFQATTLYKQSSCLEIEVKPLNSSHSQQQQNNSTGQSLDNIDNHHQQQQQTSIGRHQKGPLKSCMTPAARARQQQQQQQQQHNNRIRGGQQAGRNSSSQQRDNSGVRYFVALFDYDPSTMSPNPNAAAEELSFKAGSIIKIYGDRGPDEFYKGELDNRIGFVPSNVVEEIRDVNKLYSLQQQYKFPAVATNLLIAGLPGFADSLAAQQQQQVAAATAALLQNVPPQAAGLCQTTVPHLVATMAGGAQVAPQPQPPTIMATSAPLVRPLVQQHQQQHQSVNQSAATSYHQAGMPAAPAGTLAGSSGSKRMRALYDYDPRKNSPNIDTESEVPFKMGDVIHVYGKMDTDGFYMGEVERTKQRGLVPSNFLTEEPAPPSQQQQLVTVVPVQQQQQQQAVNQAPVMLNNLQLQPQALHQQPQQQFIPVVPVHQQQPLSLSMVDDIRNHQQQHQQPMPLTSNNQTTGLMSDLQRLQQQQQPLGAINQQMIGQQQPQPAQVAMNSLPQQPVAFVPNIQQQQQQQPIQPMFQAGGPNQQHLQQQNNFQPMAQNINRPNSLSLAGQQQQPQPMASMQQHVGANFNQQPQLVGVNNLKPMQQQQQQPSLSQAQPQPQQQPQLQPLGNQSMQMMMNGHNQQQQHQQQQQQQQQLQQQQLAQQQQQLRLKGNVPNLFNTPNLQNAINANSMVPNSHQNQQQQQQQQQPLYYGYQQHGMRFDAHGNPLNQAAMNGDEQGGNILNIFKNMLKL